VVALVKGSDGTASASYEYDPFGKATRTTGAMAKENPFRFSTKRADDCTDLTSYEYRTHSPSIGRWLNRDPIEESGGLNLHAFNQNVPNLRFDRYGLDSEPTPPDCAPCSWLGWKHEPVPEGDERDLGWAEFHEDPPPGFHEPITCTACRCKPGKEWTLNSARCTARIWLDPKIEPNTVVHRFTAWWHESRHIKNSVDGFKKKDAMFKTLAYCIPEACHDLRTALAYKFQLQYNLEVTWQDAAVHCGDYQTSEWCFKTFNYYQEVERVTAEAQQLASRLGECLRRECGTYE
jgi:RHS repeat-associated protein